MDHMATRTSHKVGLIGYGLAGRVFHAPLIEAAPGLDLSVIVTANAGRAAQAREDFPAAHVVPEVNAAFAGADRVDVIVVATSNDSHVPLALRAIDAGLSVVIDKPMAATVADGRRLVEQAQSAGVMATVFQNRRWDGDFLTVQDLVKSGRLGRIHRYESRFERWSPRLRENSWREDPDPSQAGGVLYDLGTHLIDQAIVLFGPVVSVFAELDRLRADSVVDDDVFVAMAHANGVRSHLWASKAAPVLGPRFRVLGDQAGYSIYGLDPQEQQLASGLRPGAPDWGRSNPSRDGLLGVLEDVETVPTLPGAYQHFYTSLVAALDGEGPPPVDPRNAVEVLRIIDAAQRSAAEEITVPMDPEPGSRQ